MSISKSIAVAIAVIAVVVIAVTGLAVLVDQEPRPIPPAPGPRTDTFDLTAPNLFREMNEERVAAGLKPLEHDPRLDKSAQLKADELNRTKVFEHISPDGKRGITYITDQGVKCKYQSENLAAFTEGAEGTIKGWLTSPAHRDAILDPRYETTGFGVSGEYRVQHFCDIQ